MTAPDLTTMLRDTLADEGWCCDPYGHEDGRLLLLDCLDRDDAARVQRSLACPGPADRRRTVRPPTQRDPWSGLAYGICALLMLVVVLLAVVGGGR